ncbi:MAG TPA: hypothetical protein VGA98_03085 [Allosphingosinicella sp.]|jgi:hypothetical protein
MAIRLLATDRAKVALENAKLTTALVRDFTIGLLLVLLFLAPAFINDRLTAAGFEEGSFLSLKWKKKVIQDDTALKEAREIIQRQKEQLERQHRALTALQRQVPAVAAVPGVARLQEETRQLAVQSQSGLDALQSTIRENRSIVAKAAESAADPRWVVIFGGDSTPEAARDEIAKAIRLNLPEPQIMHRGNSYRSILIQPDRESAYALLPRARQIQSDAYAVSLNSWCPRFGKADGYLECRQS